MNSMLQRNTDQLRQVRGRHDVTLSPHGGGGDRLFRRRSSADNGLDVRAHRRRWATRRFSRSSSARRLPDNAARGDLRAYVRTVCGPLAVRSSLEAGGFALPALRRHLLDLYDPLYGRGTKTSQLRLLRQGGQERLRVGLFRGVEPCLRAGQFAEPAAPRRRWPW